MSKVAKKVTSIGSFGVTDALDVWGDKAAQAQKDAAKQAEADRAALTASQSNSPTLDSADVTAAREAERQRKLALSGQSSTILTSAGGAATANAGQKTLLGQ